MNRQRNQLKWSKNGKECSIKLKKIDFDDANEWDLDNKQNSNPIKISL